MSREASQTALHAALALSHQLVRVAERGDGEQAQVLNSQRACLLREFLNGAEPIVNEDRHTLEQITKLNRLAIECLEAKRKETMTQMKTVATGQRAVRAYGLNRSKY